MKREKSSTQQMVTASQAAALAGVSRRRMTVWLSEGRLPGAVMVLRPNPGRGIPFEWRIPVADLKAVNRRTGRPTIEERATGTGRAQASAKKKGVKR